MKKTFLALAATLSLAACAQPATQQCAQAANPDECLKVAQAGGDVNDYLLYGMAGYMLSSAINGSGVRQPVIVTNPSYRGVRRSIPSYTASRSYVSKVTTTTASVYRSPSFRSSFGSSSFRSGGFGRRR